MKINSSNFKFNETLGFHGELITKFNNKNKIQMN